MKLYKQTAAEQKLPFAVRPDHSIIVTEADNIPTLRWSNGAWCVEANMWILELYDRGLSRSDRGGTLLSYATNISHLIRYCEAQNTKFLDITDLQFNFFVRTLFGERRQDGMKPRTQNTVVNISRNCIDFIAFLAEEFHLDPRLSIRTIEKISIGPNGKKTMRRGKTHSAIPMPSRIEERFPVNLETIKRLRLAAAADIKSSSYVKARRRVMLRCMEMLGARRTEISLLKVNDIYSALKNGYLRVATLKRRDKTGTLDSSFEKISKREIPISRTDAKLLADFVTYSRAPLAKKLNVTHDYLFLNENTGERLTPNTFTSEVRKIAKLAGVLETVSPHLFRHRFITKIFVAEILKVKADSLGDFNRAILDTEFLKRKVQELTGHRSPESLDRYIHIAWDEAMGLTNALPKIQTHIEIDSIREQAVSLLATLANEGSPSRETKALLDLLTSFEALL
ncbi:tyrosine-type recombinase/integrase [Pseudomonas sp. GZD-222]|uniref:tyrosine-type recombinase/integrase n=1 Tax=Pseudomonas sp. GZD-222 TaxID=3404805 RepID=UPI003BB7BD52